MNISMNGIGEVVATLRTDGTVKVGDLVVMKENDTVTKAGTDAEPIGLCVSINEPVAGIQLKGGMTLPCEDASLKPGLCALKVTASGTAAKAASGVLHLVVSADSAAKKASVLF